MKRSSTIKRRTELKRRKKLNRVSAKQKSRLAKYYPIQQEFLRKNKWCVICTMLKGQPVPATEVHHIRSRNGDLLFDTRFFAGLCRNCRMVPHHNPKWARSVGLLSEAKDWGVVPK